MNYQHTFENTYLWGSYSPITGDSFVWEINGVDSKIFEHYLKALSEFKPREYKVVVIDNAAFHNTTNFEVPDNIYLLNIPAYSPELNPCEQIWQYIKKRYKNKTFEDMQQLRRWLWDMVCKMQNDLIKSIVANKKYKKIIYSNLLLIWYNTLGCRPAIKIKGGQVLKEDYQYKRNGAKNLFVAVEPKAGKHIVQLTQTRTKKDFAHFIKRLTDEFYPEAKKIAIVLDNLNPHFEKSIIETFRAKESERILNKIEFCHTLVHASWLNMAEIEIGILERECLNRRIANEKEMVGQIKAWTEYKNKQKMKINWSFTKCDAYKKLSNKYVS